MYFIRFTAYRSVSFTLEAQGHTGRWAALGCDASVGGPLKRSRTRFA